MAHILAYYLSCARRFAPAAAPLLFAGCHGCGNERLQEVEECRVQANHERPEICDGLDNDCDGLIDDGCDDDGDGFCDAKMALTENAGCVNGGDCADDDAEVHPGAVETCNGKDDDCDGARDTDDPGIADARLGVQCGDGIPAEKVGKGECRYGNNVCRYGAVVCQGAKGPANEICDGLDNDCNGITDEGAASFELCWSPSNPLVGECKPGVHVCRNGGIDRTVCLNEVFPKAEQCDGLDNDCNGVADDGTRNNNPVYVLFHLDCSGSMGDKISQIKTFLNDLNTLPSVYQSSSIRYGLTLYPDMSSSQLPWVHQEYADLNTFRSSLASVSTAGCGWMEPNVDSVAYGLCSSRPTVEWPQGHLCRSLYDGEWTRCGGAAGNPASHPAGSVCRSILTGGYLNGRIFDLPVPDGANQLHVMITDEDLQTNKGLTATSVNGIKVDLRARYSTQGWSAKIKVACFLSSYSAAQFSAMCDSSYTLSSNTSSTAMMSDFTKELQDIYCQ